MSEVNFKQDVSEQPLQQPQRGGALTRKFLPAVMVAGLLMGGCASEDGGPNVSEATQNDPRSHVFEFDDTSGRESGAYVPDKYIDPFDLGLLTSDEDYLNPLYKDLKSELNGKDTYVPLLQAHTEAGKLVIKDLSPEEANEGFIEWMAERIAQNPVAETMLAHGGKISVGLDDDKYASSEDVSDIGGVFGYYVHERNEVVLEVSTHINLLSADHIDQYLTHEATHALFASGGASVFNEAKPSAKQLTAYRDACRALRTAALEDIRQRMIYVEQYIAQYIRLEDDPNGAARYELLLDSLRNGTWVEFAAAEDGPLNADHKVAECVVPGLGFIQAALADSRGLPKPKPYDPDTDEFDEAAHAAFGDAQTEFSELIREVSLYSALTEGNYIAQSPMMGHPYDGLDETAASTLNILVSYPEELAYNLRYLPEDRQKAVLDMVRLVADAVSDSYPELQGYLADREAIFLDTLHG